jgi:hypothetical protein
VLSSSGNTSLDLKMQNVEEDFLAIPLSKSGTYLFPDQKYVNQLYIRDKMDAI